MDDPMSDKAEFEGGIDFSNDRSSILPLTLVIFVSRVAGLFFADFCCFIWAKATLCFSCLDR
jgi:hypothetical protein